MKKIEHIIDSCRSCRHCQKYSSAALYGEVWLCGHDTLDNLEDRDHFIVIAGKSTTPPIPSWCPLETYCAPEQAGVPDAAAPQTEAASCYIGQSKVEEKAPSTIILPGLPHLEWMTENLSGFGGTEIDGVTYYTHDQAVEAVKQLGDGWRLPTRGEMLDLDDLGSTWDDDREGRWFGGNHDTDHAGSLFLPASGYRERSSGAASFVGSNGSYWSSAPAGSGSTSAGYLSFCATFVGPLGSGSRAFGFTVRCVRNIHE